MRQEIKAAWVFWTQWIWLEAWKPSMRLVKRSSLLQVSGCIALIVGLSALLAFEGYDKTADRAEWFLFNNVAGVGIIFIGVFLYNWFIAPGRLLAREINRELVNEWLTVINGKVAEAGKLIEAIRLGQDMTIAQ